MPFPYTPLTMFPMPLYFLTILHLYPYICLCPIVSPLYVPMLPCVSPCFPYLPIYPHVPLCLSMSLSAHQYPLCALTFCTKTIMPHIFSNTSYVLHVSMFALPPLPCFLLRQYKEINRLLSMSTFFHNWCGDDWLLFVQIVLYTWIWPTKARSTKHITMFTLI